MIQATRLYIKQHLITGLKYLGKTSRDPYEYKGSGVYWKNHINKYGPEHIKTLWVSEEFIDEEYLSEFALFLSEELDVVNSDKWANLRPENGLDGGGGKGENNPMYGKRGVNNPNYGKSPSEETRLKISAALKGKPQKPVSEETKLKMSISRKGKQGNNTKYSEEDFKQIINDYSLGTPKSYIVKKYSNMFSRSTIYKVLTSLETKNRK